MTALPSTRRVAMHEAFHTASLLYDQWPPLAVSVDVANIFLGETRIGSTKVDWTDRELNTKAMRDLAVSVLLGPAADGASWLWDWPIPDNAGDADQLRFIAQWLGCDHVGWLALVCEAERRAKDRTFRRIALCIADALEMRGELFKPELIELSERVLG